MSEMQRDGSEMRCKRCGANESRIHGFCSVECEHYFDYEEEITDLNARIAELEAEIDIRKDQLREAKNILIDKNLQIDSLYEGGYKLQKRIAELEALVNVSEGLYERIYEQAARIAELEAECDRAKAIVSRLRDFLFDYTNLKISNSQDDRWWALVDKFDELTTESEK